MFVDQVTITVRSGDGGDGCSSFRREKFVPQGGPDGGDGGNGGDVIFEADPHLTTLLDLRYKRNYQAENGAQGKGKQMTGRQGGDCLIKVPVGTLVKDERSGEILADLVRPRQRFVPAKGGKGGHGNARFKSSVNRTPRHFGKGKPGEEFTFSLELKLLADVAIVGFPNAGKSTLISKISKARPKIADYPFTTLTPHLGVVSLGGYRSIVAADIPGLIEGAHTGKGLGIQFLKHTERTRLLLHLIDFSASNVRDPLDDYNQLQIELRNFSKVLADKPQILVASKVDHPEAREKFLAYRDRLEKLNSRVFAISSITGEGVSSLLEQVGESLKDSKKELDEWGE